MALLGALCVALNAVGFTSRSLRAQVSRLLGVTETPNQMSYDLGRLRLNGLIERIEGTNNWVIACGLSPWVNPLADTRSPSHRPRTAVAAAS